MAEASALASQRGEYIHPLDVLEASIRMGCNHEIESFSRIRLEDVEQAAASINDRSISTLQEIVATATREANLESAIDIRHLLLGVLSSENADMKCYLSSVELDVCRALREIRRLQGQHKL